MGKLTCDCLNIQIHTKSELIPFDSTAIIEKLCKGECCKEFFSQHLSEVLLNLEGVFVAYPSLLRTHPCGSWCVHKCGNCNAFTHATSTLIPDDCRILVQSGLISDDDAAFEALLSSDDYSPAYKIVLKSSPETFATSLSIDQVSPDVRKQLETIQTQLNSFLVTEESQMEERIRSYEKSERDAYARLQSKARSDKNLMLSRLLNAVYQTVSESLSDAMVESPIGSLVEHMHMMQAERADAHADRHAADESSQPLDESDHDNPDTFDEDVVFPLPRLPVGRNSSVTGKRSLTSAADIVPAAVSRDFRVGLSEQIDDVFQFDPGFQEDSNTPFSESDDDVNDTDDTPDSSLVDDGIHRSSHSSGSSRGGTGGPVGAAPGAGFSTSVPIDVPAWMRFSATHSQHMQFDDEDDLDSAPRDPARMAASIQAMARSVHGQTSEIFGELPKPPTRANVSVRRSTSYR